jgi:hypothetical protein
LANTDNDNNHTDDGAIGTWQFTESDKLTLYTETNTMGLKKSGDILPYISSSGTSTQAAISHTSMVYCVKGDRTGLCEDLQAREYRILHASGDEKVCYGSKKIPDWCTGLNRKVVINQITSNTRGTLLSPFGIGRVMLWD